MATWRSISSSLKKLLARDDAIYWPTHGGPIRDPKPFVKAYLDHRYEREAQILACLRDGISTIPDMVARIYVGLDPSLRAAAGLSVFAHLLQMTKDGRVDRPRRAPPRRAHFQLARA